MTKVPLRYAPCFAEQLAPHSQPSGGGTWNPPRVGGCTPTSSSFGGPTYMLTAVGAPSTQEPNVCSAGAPGPSGEQPVVLGGSS